MPRIDVNGVSLNVTHLPQKRGQGDTPMLFVHGLAASSAFWYMAGAPLMARLGDAVLYDLRGHGKSSVPESGFGVTTMALDMLGVMDAMELERAHVIAHSFGGMIALLAALKSPDRVASLILADVRVRPLQQKLELPARNIPTRLAERLDKIGVSVQAINDQDDGIDYLKTVARIQLAAGDEANDLLREIYHHPQLFRSRKNAEKWIALTERASFVEELKHGESFEPKDLAGLTMPKLVMYGTNSTTGPSSKALTRLCPNSILHGIPDVGHFFPISNPRLFLKPAARFLRAVNAGRVPIVTPQ
jgi:pimeloyl-ACP methyl ester carboxylesterase